MITRLTKKKKKWSAKISLFKELDASLPEYIFKNKDKYKEWLDI